MILSLFGCSTKIVKFSVIEPVMGEGAVVYIYRPNSLSNVVISPDVLIDGKKEFEIKNNVYTSLTLPAGVHAFNLALSKRYEGQHSIELELSDAEVYFLRIDTKMKFQMNDLYKRRFDILKISKDIALLEISECRDLHEKQNQHDKIVQKEKSLSPVLDVTKVKTETVEKEKASILNDDPDSVFSISKTKNPFSKTK